MELSYDIHKYLFILLDFDSIRNLSKVNKTFSTVCLSENNWKEKFEIRFGQRIFPLFHWRKGYFLQENKILTGKLILYKDDIPVECTFKMDLTDLNPWVDHDDDDDNKEYVNFYCDMYIEIINNEVTLNHTYQDERVLKGIQKIFQPYLRFYEDIDFYGMFFQTWKDSVGCHSFKRRKVYEFQIGAKQYQELVNIFARYY